METGWWRWLEGAGAEVIQLFQAAEVRQKSGSSVSSGGAEPKLRCGGDLGVNEG